MLSERNHKVKWKKDTKINIVSIPFIWSTRIGKPKVCDEIYDNGCYSGRWP